MSGTPAATTFGSGKLQGHRVQLNIWAPQTELSLQELRGAQLVMSGQRPRLVETHQHHRAFRSELDTRTMEKSVSDDRLKQKIEHLAIKVQEELVEIERAIATSAALQLSGDQAAPSARQRRRERATPPRKEKRPRDHSKRLKRHAGIARTRNAGPTVRTCFGAHETESGDRALDYLAAVRPGGRG